MNYGLVESFPLIWLLMGLALKLNLMHVTAYKPMAFVKKLIAARALFVMIIRSAAVSRRYIVMNRLEAATPLWVERTQLSTAWQAQKNMK